MVYNGTKWDKVVNMLIGEYKHTIDEKNRVSLPSKFRKSIGKSMVITHGLDNCLSLYPLTEWKKISEKLGNLGFGSSDARRFNRVFLGSAVEVVVDKAGRILIPQNLRDSAKLDGKIVFTGVHDRVEIWNEGMWDEYKKNALSQADDIAQKLGDVGAI